MNHVKGMDENKTKKLNVSAWAELKTRIRNFPSRLPRLRPWPKRVMGRQFSSKRKRWSCFSINWWFNFLATQALLITYSCPRFWYLTDPCHCHLTRERDKDQAIRRTSSKSCFLQRRPSLSCFRYNGGNSDSLNNSLAPVSGEGHWEGSGLPILKSTKKLPP